MTFLSEQKEGGRVLYLSRKRILPLYAKLTQGIFTDRSFKESGQTLPALILFHLGAAGNNSSL